ncbi:MAG TPA: thioredoxin domain-containing protein, partial [Bdellovibrionales bacterium]|nr:thioredoxin domain-containing protein [Bdellovibrionales bacterium]
MNRLANEKSPYLLQHKNNPVDWYPWGPEAFDKARREDKPIFLSIGYSTCHWCHVMEHESFEDAEVAALLNRAFVNIKVDREERPDIDHIYMTVCQMMTGSGGWPLTIVMTPDQKPFFAGTYFPKDERYGRAGMLQLVPRLEDVWKTERAKVLESADQILEFVVTNTRPRAGEALGEDVIKSSLAQLKSSFDNRHAGFGSAPKFPSPHNLMFLLRCWRRFKDGPSLDMVERTLQAMRAGGMYDQLGFGFHRYSVDRMWLVPHFEKMLYDQALLALAYLETFQATGKDDYGSTAREIFEYVLRDMKSPEGGLYSAEDADSEGVEGKFYVWDHDELKRVLTDAEFKLVSSLFNVHPEGNFNEMGEPSPHNILHLSGTFRENAARLGYKDEGVLREEWEKARQKLFAIRARRVHPHKDDKVLTDWNGLMIAALAKGAQVLDDESGRYVKGARDAFEFVITRMSAPGGRGRLYHRFRDGEAAIEANADDYAFMMWAAVELYHATFESRYLKHALTFAEILLEDFWDRGEGGLYFTPPRGEALIVRKKEIYDGAVPSGNAVAMWNFLRLAKLTGRAELEERANEIGKIFSSDVRSAPTAHNMMLLGLDFGLGPAIEVVVAG